MNFDVTTCCVYRNNTKGKNDAAIGQAEPFQLD